jgi:hypothetical protein
MKQFDDATEAYLVKLVAEAPPLSPEQRILLRNILLASVAVSRDQRGSRLSARRARCRRLP